MSKILLCSDCFKDEGLKLDSFQIGFEAEGYCPNCHSETGRKLTADLVNDLAYRYFVQGTTFKTEFGGAPIIQFNEYQKTSLKFSEPLNSDVKLIENTLGVGFFYYGPRLWMVGQVEPLLQLQTSSGRKNVIKKIISTYPTIILNNTQSFYRLRKNPSKPEAPLQYDSPPKSGSGRLDANRFPVLYGSQNIEVCIHECRVTLEDEIYVATLRPLSELKLLNLAIPIYEEGITEFESLSIAIRLLHSAGSPSYEILRNISKSIKKAGFDGIIYPSYFSSLSNGSGISSLRKKKKFPFSNEEFHVIPNIALFGRPIKEKKLSVQSINRIILDRVEYDIQFGPVKY